MANGQISINSPEELEAWLRDKPPEWMQVIAVRTALRVLPLVGRVMKIPDSAVSFDLKLNLLLQSFRGAFVSWMTAKDPSSNLSTVGVAAGQAAVSAARAAGSLAYKAEADAIYVAADRAADSVAEAAKNNALHAVARASAAAGVVHADANDVGSIRTLNRLAGQRFWEAIRADAIALELKRNRGIDQGRPQSLLSDELLIDQPLWLIDVREGERPGGGGYNANMPNWAREPFDRMAEDRRLNEAGFGVWIEWYRALLPNMIGRPPSTHFGEELDIKIATQSNVWWSRDPNEVNADIAKWINDAKEEANDDEWTAEISDRWDFFISYSMKDHDAAIEIDTILAEQGYSTFVQFRDFATGNNLVREMQRGLAGAGRVIALYSPDYEASDHCQAEWSAAYNMDPGGAKRKLLPFMIRPTELNPLARQIVYKSLVGLNAAERRVAVLEAIRYQPHRRRPDELKRTLAEVASPEVSITEDGKIDAGANKILDIPVLDDDLANLPEVQRTLADTIRNSLPRNAPTVVSGVLGSYREHLAQRGSQPIVGLLQQLGSALRAEFESEEFDTWDPGLASLFESFFGNHELLITHFPLSEEREQIFSETAVDEEAASGPALSEPLDDVHEATEELAESDQTTPEFDKTLKLLTQIGRDMASLPSPRTSVDDPPNKITPKKRYILGAIGFLVTLYGVVGSTASIATTPTGAAFLKTVAEAIEKLMQFVVF